MSLLPIPKTPDIVPKLTGPVNIFGFGPNNPGDSRDSPDPERENSIDKVKPPKEYDNPLLLEDDHAKVRKLDALLKFL